MRLCHIVPSLEERHGGPSKSVRALAQAQSSQGAAVDLLFTHGGGPAASPVDCVPLPCLGFARQFPARIYRSPALRAHLLATPYACVHSHALWVRTVHYAAEAARRHRVPLVLSPRGMLSPWAYQHHRGRKRLAELLVHPGALRAAAGWHATSTEEADDIRRLGFAQPVCVSPNGVDLPGPDELAPARAAWLELVPAARNRPVALFYSRFHRKKRVRELLDLWLAAPRGDWLLVMAGVSEEYTVDEIRGWVAARGAGDRVAVADGAGRPAPYAIASLFLLPSHSENFGLVIAEAMAAGVPVLVTDGTPWTRARTQDAGWCVPWADYAGTLAGALQRPAGELAAMGRRGRAWMAEDFSWANAGRLLLTFYQHLVHG
jgi:glycosyltransferase involved in cell wall biosynthesis